MREKTGLTVATHGNVEKALRKLKKKLALDGRLQDSKARKNFVKPTTKKKMAKAAAVKRNKKELAKTQRPPRMY